MAPFDFELVAYAVTVGVIQAYAITIVTVFWELTRFRSSRRYACFLEIEQDAVIGIRISVDKDLNVQ